MAGWSAGRECASTKKPLQEPRAQASSRLACQPHLSQAEGNEAQQDLLEKRFPGSGKAFRTKAGAASHLLLGQSCAMGLKTHTCLLPPGFIQAPQMYNFHIVHAGGLMSAKEFPLIS